MFADYCWTGSAGKRPASTYSSARNQAPASSGKVSDFTLLCGAAALRLFIPRRKSAMNKWCAARCRGCHTDFERVCGKISAHVFAPQLTLQASPHDCKTTSHSAPLHAMFRFKPSAGHGTLQGGTYQSSLLLDSYVLNMFEGDNFSN